MSADGSARSLTSGVKSIACCAVNASRSVLNRFCREPGEPHAGQRNLSTRNRLTDARRVLRTRLAAEADSELQTFCRELGSLLDKAQTNAYPLLFVL